MTPKKFNKIKEEIANTLLSVKYSGDLSDLGNEIGVIIAKYFDKNNTKSDFLHGLDHGVSLTDGTHP